MEVEFSNNLHNIKLEHQIGGLLVHKIIIPDLETTIMDQLLVAQNMV